MLQVVVDGRRALRGLADGGEVVVQAAELDGGHIPLASGREDGVNVVLRRAAAVVTHAIEAQYIGELRRGLVGSDLDPFRHLAAFTPEAVVVRRAGGEQLRAVGRLPLEDLAGEGLLVRSRAEEDEGVHALLGVDLREHLVVAEGVNVVAGGGEAAEFLEQETLAVQALAHEGLGGGDVVIRLHPPAAAEFPAALGHARFDLLVHRGPALLDPGIEDDLAGGEGEVRVFVHAVKGGAEGVVDFLHALLPAPEPGGVNMGVANHVDGRIGHVKGVLSRYRRPHPRPHSPGGGGGNGEALTGGYSRGEGECPAKGNAEG